MLRFSRINESVGSLAGDELLIAVANRHPAYFPPGEGWHYSNTGYVVAGLMIAHKFVPAGRRSFLSVLPGVGVTLLLWLLGGIGFGWYLEFFPGAYASTYGGLATAMVALIFLYTLGAIFLFGGELNGTIILAKRRRLSAEPKPAHLTDVITMP